MQRGTKRFAADAPEDHASYLARKNSKLAEQDAETGALLRAERGASAAASATLFAGVRLWVNGLTDPPAEVLKEIVLEHGGQFFNTHHHTVTHIVTENLSVAREEGLRRSKTVQVVTAAWVVESQRQGKLLKEALFSGLTAEPAQRSVAALLSSSPGGLPERLARTNANAQQLRGAQPGRAPSPERLARAQALARELHSAYPGLQGAPKSTLDGSPAAFLATYRANSRLHHIGSWRQRIGTPVCDGPQPSADPALERICMHVDMDCFFVSVMVRDHPVFKGLPVVVSHGAATSGSSGEVSSVSYEALRMGVFKGQRVRDAEAVCPDLIVLPYNFAKFDEVSLQVFRVLASFSAAMQPMSVDEAYLDVTGLTDEPEQLAAAIRDKIWEVTRGCSASIGIGPNKLVAKLATRRAKPDGIFRVTAAGVRDFVAPLPVSSLIGVGRETADKLLAMGIETAGQLLAFDLPSLQRAFGPVLGSKLQVIAKGESESPVQPPEKHNSVSVNCNWGVRFRQRSEADAFLAELARELAEKLEFDGRVGRKLTLRVLRSRDITVEPPKFLGHGFCDSFTRLVTFKCATAHAAQLAEEAKLLLTALKIEPNWIRGLGLELSDLVLPAPGTHVAPGIQPSMAAVLAAPVAAQRPRSVPQTALLSTREYADLSVSQLPQETLAALGTQVVAELNVSLRSTRNRGGLAGKRQPTAKPSHPVAKQHKVAAKKMRKQASSAAKATAVVRPAAAAPAPSPARLCELSPVLDVRAALQDCVPRLAALPDCDDRLRAAGRLLEAFCAACVTQNDLLSVRRLLRFARSLVAEAPAWRPHCEAAVDASQRSVLERFHTTILLTDP